MEYSIKELSELAGVSPRTLRYYGEIELLLPFRTNEAGYRFYGEKEVEIMQQILFYRERGLGLEQIKNILYQNDFDILSALYSHLNELENQKERLDSLITTVKKTILAKKGEEEMSDKERFEIFKENMLQKNEDKYGQEVRTKYGDTSMEQANEKIRDMTAADYQRFQKLGDEILLCLKEAVTQGISPKSEEGKRIVLLHKEWLGMTWKTYSKQAHEGLAQIYVLDQRFMTYYDREVPGCAKFLRNAVGFWLDNM